MFIRFFAARSILKEASSFDILIDVERTSFLSSLFGVLTKTKSGRIKKVENMEIKRNATHHSQMAESRNHQLSISYLFEHFGYTTVPFRLSIL